MFSPRRARGAAVTEWEKSVDSGSKTWFECESMWIVQFPPFRCIRTMQKCWHILFAKFAICNLQKKKINDVFGAHRLNMMMSFLRQCQVYFLGGWKEKNHSDVCCCSNEAIFRSEVSHWPMSSCETSHHLPSKYKTTVREKRGEKSRIYLYDVIHAWTVNTKMLEAQKFFSYKFYCFVCRTFFTVFKANAALNTILFLVSSHIEFCTVTIVLN